MGQPQPLIVAFGGGVNSAAMLIGMHERGIRPDLILFADTGGEKPETYAYLDIIRRWLGAVGFPELVTVEKDSMYTSLEDQCHRTRTLPSLAYGWKSCSEKWKRKPQDKFCNHWPAAVAAWQAGQKCTKAIGYDADEERRAKIAADAKYTYWYPLIEWQWGREECLAAIARAGLPKPPKSACFFCPASKKPEILWLARTHPDLFRRAIAIEGAAAETLKTVKGLGRYFSWAEFVKMTAQEQQATCEGPECPCGCFDGDE